MKDYLWNQTEVSKEARQGETVSASFTYFGNKQFKKVYPSCDCMTVSVRHNHISVKWKTKKKPTSYTSTKYVTVVFDDDSIDELTITAELSK